jgi:hypothetical protein
MPSRVAYLQARNRRRNHPILKDVYNVGFMCRAGGTTHGQAEINVIDPLARAELASLRFDRARGRRSQEYFICGYLPGLM